MLALAMVLSAVCALLGLTAAAPAAAKPNIVLFLTDDQDQMLGASFPRVAEGGATPMPKTMHTMEEGGTMATNFFIHTPICCPSRSELISGRYFHNIKTTHAPACMHVNETLVNNNTFAKYLKEDAGYTVGMFGKYLNIVPNFVPVGFDYWLANGGGNYIAPSFSTFGLDWYGIADGHWHGTKENYTTAVVGNISIAFIKKAVAEKKPFFAYVAPKAAHEPFNPAPWYEGYWDSSWPETEPRPVAWNCSAESRADHHGNIATEDMISANEAVVITGVFKNRWRTLMSVDDVIGAVIGACEDLSVADNTYFFYTSDHGFQLGEFNIAMDKRNVYDWNTRIHLLARGPGIKKGAIWNEPATQVDLAPTFLGLAGLPKPPQMDGKSLVPLLVAPELADALAPASAAHMSQVAPAGSDAYRAGWRDAAFIEYYFNDKNAKCMEECHVAECAYPDCDSGCVELGQIPNTGCWQGCRSNCYPTESPANNFIAIRNMKGSELGDTLYAEYQSGLPSQSWTNMIPIDFTKPDFIEYYNATADKWQMENLHKTTEAATLSKLHDKLHMWYNCAGDTCP